MQKIFCLLVEADSGANQTVRTPSSSIGASRGICFYSESGVLENGYFSPRNLVKTVDRFMEFEVLSSIVGRR